MRRRIDQDDVKAKLDAGWHPESVARYWECSASYIKLIARGAVGAGYDNRQTRMRPHTAFGAKARGLPAIDHPAIMGGRTIFPSTVIEPGQHRVLKSGHNSSKIGKTITKGRWKGFEIYTLTLEERATCPHSCRHWRSCFGNNMQQAHRFRAGLELEGQLVAEVAALSAAHPGGFAVRLHVLGDFYSVGYVALWAALLDDYPPLHCFGFSARWDYGSDPVAKALVDLAHARWSRFAIRFSNAPVTECSTISIEHPYQKPDDAIVCPQEMGQTATCSTCAFCWQSTKRVAFIQH